MNTRSWLIVVILFSPCFVSAQEPDTTKFISVGPEDFYTMIRHKENIILLDVRTHKEFRKERIEGAVNVPLARLRKKHSLHLSRTSTLLVYCTAGVRSAWAGERLHELGYSNLYNLKGGISAWKKKGLPVSGRLVTNDE